MRRGSITQCYSVPLDQALGACVNGLPIRIVGLSVGYFVVYSACGAKVRTSSRVDLRQIYLQP
jgi:hypothetical protein